MNEGGADIKNTKLAFMDDNFEGVVSAYNIIKDDRVLFIPYSKLLTFEQVSSTIMGQLMLKKGLKEKLGPIYFFCAYILLERRRPNPEERDFGPFLDVLPDSTGEFPIFF